MSIYRPDGSKKSLDSGKRPLLTEAEYHEENDFWLLDPQSQYEDRGTCLNCGHRVIYANKPGMAQVRICYCR